MLAFDIDGIYLNSHQAILEEINSLMNINLTLKDWTEYDIHTKLGISEHDFRQIYERVLLREDIPPINGAPEVIAGLYAITGKPILFITARREQWARAAYANIMDTLPSQVEIDVINNGYTDTGSKIKYLLSRNVEFFFEDNPQYWSEYIMEGIFIGTLDHPWCGAMARKMGVSLFKNWDGIGRFITELNGWTRLVKTS